jgi:signal peptidase I
VHSFDDLSGAHPADGSDPEPDGATPDTGTVTRPGPKEDEPPRSRTKVALEWVLVIGGALLVAFLIKTFLFQAFYIPSESMEPTLVDRDRVIVNKLSYRLHDVNRGDLVVFDRPPSEPPTEVDELIKRVIALPGETIEARDGEIYIDGRLLSEPYLRTPASSGNFGPVTVPDGHVFVMGDNRMNSRDSRVFGPIDQDLIVGRAFVRVWPLGRLAFL